MIQNRVTAGEYTLKPVGEKTRSIASLRGKIAPIIGKCVGIMGRANAIRPYNNPRNPVNPDSKPGLQATQSPEKRSVQHP